MIIYSSTKTEFMKDVDIATTVEASFVSEVGYHPAPSQIGAFRNSLPYMRRVMEISEIPNDAGIGFLGTLKNKFPDLKNDIDAIKFGLEGNSGWFEGKRGNGLLNIKDWTFKEFNGNICIHSGRGLVSLDGERIEEQEVYKITGTIVQVMLYYK